jgi:hypothetical protein
MDGSQTHPSRSYSGVMLFRRFAYQVAIRKTDLAALPPKTDRCGLWFFHCRLEAEGLAGVRGLYGLAWPNVKQFEETDQVERLST